MNADLWMLVCQYLKPKQVMRIQRTCQVLLQVITQHVLPEMQKQIIASTKSYHLKRIYAKYGNNSFFSDYYSHRIEYLHISHLTNLLVQKMDGSGYFTRQTPAFCLQKKLATISIQQVAESLHAPCTMEPQYSLVEFYRELKQQWKQPRNWLCSYEYPMRLRIAWGCLKQIIHIMKHGKSFCMFKNINYDTHYLLGMENEHFMVVIYGRQC